MKKIKTILTLIGALIALKTNATINNVGPNKTFSTIQSAINASANGDTVLVQEGTYIENIDFSGKKIIVSSLYLIDNNTLHINQTIIDGNYAGSVVKFINGEDSTSILKGFAIKNGLSSQGGGIYCLNASPRLDHLIIAYNNANSYGGGLYLENSFSRVTYVNSYYNKAENSGGGILIRGGGPILENFIASYDSAKSMGAGIFIGWNSNPILKNLEASFNTITDTASWMISGSGGGMMCWTNSNPTLIKVNIHDNIAKSGGGMACWYNSLPNFISARITKNYLRGVSSVSSNGGGGGLEIYESDVVVKNTLIAKNTAQKGGGVFIYGSNTKFINVTFIDNEATVYEKGGAIYKGWGGVMDVVNCLMHENWAPLNQSPSKVDNIFDCGSGCSASITPEIINISYSLIQSGISSIKTDRTLNYDNTNIDAYPFYNTNYELMSNSPCMDAGTPDTSNLKLPKTDLAGNQRISNCRIDMGAYEYYIPNSLNATITPDGPTTFCQGDSVTLTANAATSYLWNNNATTQSITTSTNGNYSVTVKDANGCSATSTPTDVQVNSLPTAFVTANPSSISLGNTTTLTASAADTYYWSNGLTTNPIIVSPSNTTTYCVTVTNTSGCTDSACVNVYLTPTGVQSYNEKNSILISPNPFSSSTTLYTEKFLYNATLTIFNAFGQQVIQIKNISGQTISLHRNNLQSGVYFIHLTQENKILSKEKLIIADK